MLHQFKSYFTKLEALSNDELDRSAQTLVRAENQSVAKLIAHLAEMSSRNTALQMGYRSLYDYCIKRLNLSEGAVPARVHVANVCQRFPSLLVALAEGQVSLTVASLVAPHLTDDNVERLLCDCAGKTRRATEEYLVSLRPKPVFAPSIRKRPSREVLPTPVVPQPVAGPAPEPKLSPPVLQPARLDVFNFRFSAGRDFKDELERLAQVVGVENAQNHMAEVMEKALDIALDKKDPQKKLERRRKRAAARDRTPRSNEVDTKPAPTPSRYIPSEVSERIHERGNHRCEFRADDGRRCTARAGLQIDHVKPFAIHQSHDERFLRLLCPQHNRFAAERVYGAAFMKRKIQERTHSRAP